MITYRKTTAADIESVMDIRLEMLREVNGLGKAAPFSGELVRAAREYFLHDDQTTVFAEEGNAVAGCASVCFVSIMPTFDHPAGRRAHLMNVYVRPRWRRRGIAREMVRQLVAEAKERGCTEISLDATESGRPLYQSLGFRDSEECMVMEL